ncbi:MAG: class I SAM-dependent methyltransferase [Acidobacteria bacterium]|nr:class I SAM-dependent methyltransferase [Acidobacteriota bacterium]
MRRWSGAGPADWERYHAMIAERLRPGMTVVDVGCGDGGVKPFPWEQHRRVRLIGLDPDPAAEANPMLDDFRLLDPEREWPVETGGADLVLARYVLEHVARPEAFLAEARRALTPGGELLLLTPNRRHPAMLASAALPLALKRRILRRARGTAEDDVFETHYRMNTPGALGRQLRQAGFEVQRLEARELEPCGYLEGTAAGYAAACLWYAAVTATGLERFIGAHILARAVCLG